MVNFVQLVAKMVVNCVQMQFFGEFENILLPQIGIIVQNVVYFIKYHFEYKTPKI